jgi:hypothetical protein
LHWKQPPPTTTDIVVQAVRNTNDSIPWDALPEETRPKPVFRDKANPILYHLQSLNTRSRLRALTEEVIMKLRASTDCPCPLPFRIDCSSFIEWSDLSDKGGYEYDGKQKAIIIKPSSSSLLSEIVAVFAGWFCKIQQELKQNGIRLRCAFNLGLSSFPIVIYSNFDSIPP